MKQYLVAVAISLITGLVGMYIFDMYKQKQLKNS
jgi:hypothetical protein